jgi:predicted dehydrogenase
MKVPHSENASENPNGEKKMSKNKIRMGLYGCNMYRTRELMEGAEAARPGAIEISACYDAVREKADFAAERYGGVACYDEKTFLEQDMEVALISLPPYLHPDAFAACAAAGKDVYLEKPVCVDQAGKERLLKAATDYPVTCYVGLSYRYTIPFRKVAEILRRKDAGKILGMHHHWLTPGPGKLDMKNLNWRNRLEQSGGQLVFHCCHAFDFFRWVGGEIESVTGCCYTPEEALLQHEEQELTACFRFKSGGQTVFNFHQRSHRNIQFGIVNTENLGIYWEWGHNTQVRVYKTRPRAADEGYEWSLTSLPGDGADRDAHQMADFIDAYLEEREMPCTIADGIKAYDIACAVRESCRTGRTVAIP